MSEDGQKEGEFEKFASAALRSPRASVYQQLLAGLLVKANTSSDPLRKIHVICEACYLSKNKDKLNMELIDSCFLLCNSFLNTQVKTNDYKASIAWTFPLTEENWQKHIAPWQKIDVRYYAYETRLRKRKYPERPVFDNFPDHEAIYFKKAEARDLIFAEISKMPKFQAFFEMTSAIDAGSLMQLKGEFENWALSQLLTMQIAVAEQVTPEVYSEAFKLMYGDKPKQEAESESEGPMVPGQ